MIPKIDWDSIDEVFNWFAVDKDGCGYVFEEEPSPLKDVWCTPITEPFNQSIFFERYKEFKNDDWKNTLQKRP